VKEYNMKQRIEELAKQAGLNKPHGSDQEYIGNLDWRLFGELVVKECVNAVIDGTMCGDEYAMRIEKHFGIEE
jgi:hypothetical protein